MRDSLLDDIAEQENLARRGHVNGTGTENH